MSFQTFVTQQLGSITSMLNSLSTNAKKIDELPAQSSLNSSSKIHVSIGGVSQYITVSQLMAAFSNSNVDRLLFIGDIPPIVSNVLSIPPAGCIIDGVNYTTAVDTPIAVPYCTTDFTRIDIIVFGVGGIYSVPGNETVGIAVAEPLPDNTVYITQVTVTDSDISEVPVPITGFDFIRKDEKAEVEINDTGAIDILFPDQRAIGVLTGSVTTIQTVDVDSTTTYQNKKYAFKNHQATAVTFEHLSSSGSAPFKFSFPDEVDFVLEPNEVIEFLKVKTSTPIFEFIGKVKFEIENINGLQDALDDKASIAYVDALQVGLWDDRGTYTVNASGNINYPSSGGSGSAGALLKGDIFTVGGAVVGTSTVNSIQVNNGDTIRVLVDSPSPTNDANWAIGENNIGYIPENAVNKVTTMSGNTTSNIVYLSAKAIYDWAVALFVPQTRTITINATAYDLSANRSWTITSGITNTIRTTTASNLATQDVAGFLTFVNAVSSFAIASNEIVEYQITDTGQIFKILPNNRSVGSGQTALVSSDVIEMEHTETILQHLGVYVKFNQASASAYPFAGGALNSGILQGALTTNVNEYSNSYVRFIAASGVNNSGYRFSDGNSFPTTYFKGVTFFGIINPLVTTNLSAILGMPHAASISGTSENTTQGAWFNITGNQIQAKCAYLTNVSMGTAVTITATEWLLCMIEVIENNASVKTIRFTVRKTDGTFVYNRQDITSNIPPYNVPTTNSSTGVRAILATTPGSNTDIFGLASMGFWASKPNWLKYF